MPLRNILFPVQNKIGTYDNITLSTAKSNEHSARSLFSLENYVRDEDLVEGEDYEVVRIEDSKTVEEPFKSAIDGFFKTRKDNTLDGTIGETHQHSTGDCWLLSGINSMSYTEAGREIIKSAIKPCEDGGVIVELKGANNYYISPKAINQASVSPYYSSGDLDMICFELAIEGVRNDVINGNIVTPDNTPWFVPTESNKKSETGYSSANGGLHNEVVYLITGKESEAYCNPDEIEAALDKIEKDGRTNIAASVDLYEEKNIKDYDGNDIVLAGHHAYAVKSVEGDCVTITNPWNSGAEIKIKRDVFTNDVCNWLRYTDLSDENEQKSYMVKVNTTTEEKCGYSIKNGTDKNNKVRRIDELDEEGRVTDIKKYDEDGKLTSIKTYGYLENGSLRVRTDSAFDENEILTQKNTYIYNSDETLERDSVKYFYENGNLKEKTRNEYKNGEMTEKINNKYGEDESLTEETVSSYLKGHINTSKKSVYDENNNITKTINKGYKDGELYETKTTDYNDDGNKTCVTRETYNKNGTVSNLRTEYYDLDGNMIRSETNIFNSEGEQIISMENDYDEKDVINSYTRNYNKDGNIKYIQHSYTDNKGFKVTETDKNGDGVFDEVSRSKI